MDERRRRRKCASCYEELSRAAYYRHLNDRTGAVCHGKRRRLAEQTPSEEGSGSDELFSSSDFDEHLDTTFDFVSESENLNAEESENQDDFLDDKDEDGDLSSASVDSTDEEEDMGEEIWESASSESENEPEATNLNSNEVAYHTLMGIFLFVTTFQLLFRVSERAMSFLLLFIKILMVYLSAIVNHPVITELCHILPKTMFRARRLFSKASEGVVEFVVCPKCNKLYKFSECIC